MAKKAAKARKVKDLNVQKKSAVKVRFSVGESAAPALKFRDDSASRSRAPSARASREFTGKMPISNGTGSPVISSGLKFVTTLE